MTVDTQGSTFHAGLPAWFLRFQDTVGLSLLVAALMTINGVVYASGVVRDIERPDTWGTFGTIMFVAFFLAGTAMPGIALRAGAGIFAGPWLRRLCCAGIALAFFALEVWASVTERSLMTFTTPADRWLLSVLRMPTLPFSPTVFALSMAISIAVVAWGIVVTPPAIESADDVRRKEELKTIKAQGRAQRATIYGAAIGGAGRAAVQAATQDHSTAIAADDVPASDGPHDEQSAQESTDEGEPEARPLRARERGRQAAPAGLMSAPEFRRTLAEGGVIISDEEARKAVRNAAGFKKVGTTYYADRRALNAAAKRRINEAHPTIQLVG